MVVRPTSTTIIPPRGLMVCTISNTTTHPIIYLPMIPLLIRLLRPHPRLLLLMLLLRQPLLPQKPLETHHFFMLRMPLHLCMHPFNVCS